MIIETSREIVHQLGRQIAGPYPENIGEQMSLNIKELAGKLVEACAAQTGGRVQIVIE